MRTRITTRSPLVLSLLLAAVLGACSPEQLMNVPGLRGTIGFDLATPFPASVSTVTAIVREGSMSANPSQIALLVNGAHDQAVGSASVLAGKVYYLIEARNAAGSLVLQSILDSVTVAPASVISVFPVLICMSPECDGTDAETGNMTVTAISPTHETEPNDLMASATGLPEHVTATGRITAGNGRISIGSDVDYFSFSVPANARVTVHLYAEQVDETNMLDAEVGLLDPAGGVIAANNDCAQPSTLDSCTITTQPLAAGQYALRVSSHQGGSTGRYTVVVSKATATGNLLVQDDFSGTLSKWTTQSDGGVWGISDGNLVGEYDIACGSVSCTHSDILLADAQQPGERDWRMEVQMTSVRYPYSADYDLTYAMTAFVLYAGPNERVAIFAGWATRNTTMPDAVDSLQVDVQAGMPWTHVSDSASVRATRWHPGEWNTVALERHGDVYTLFFNGEPYRTFTRTFSVTPKVGLHVYGKSLNDNFRLYGF